MKVRSGQVALYLIMTLVAIMVLVLMNASAFLAVRAKNHAMNAGDAAAIASARVQADLLNRIGRYNLEHAEADYYGDYERSREIVKAQRRLAFLGPLDCLEAAQEAARANGAQRSGEMENILSRHVLDIHTKYCESPEVYPEPWEGAWMEYANRLSEIVAKGIFAGTDNINFIDAVECFPLTSKSFYAMIKGGSWCKIVVAGWHWVLDMDSHNLPNPTARSLSAVVNSEICSLYLSCRPLDAMSESELEAFRSLLARNGAVFGPRVAGFAADTRDVNDESRYYFFYDTDFWRDWIEMDPESKFRFPVFGKVKPEFDVLGCTSIFRVEERVPRLLSDSSVLGSWSAAAKPFGTVATSEGQSIVTAEETRRLVMPAFEAVRLIPLSAAYVDGKDLSTADSAWLTHIREHIREYYANGESGISSGCAYCALLRKWEDKEFRARAARWIELNGETCTRSAQGSGPTGGTSYAH